MYELMVKDSFAAAHNLRDYKGKCERVHGHNYAVEAVFAAKKLAKDGLAVDFSVLKEALKDVLEELDHRHLNNDVEFFRKNNTSAENIARYIYSGLKNRVKGPVKVARVNVWESDSAMAGYWE